MIGGGEFMLYADEGAVLHEGAVLMRRSLLEELFA